MYSYITCECVECGNPAYILVGEEGEIIDDEQVCDECRDYP